MIKFDVSILNRLPAHEKRITVSTIITLCRIALTPCIVISILHSWWLFAFGLFVIAAISDILDGFVARYLNETTVLGACLDPLADKMLIIACLATFACASSVPINIPGWFVVFMLCKEIALVAGTGIIYKLQGSVHIMPTLLGKLTTCMHCLFIGWLLLCCIFNWYSVDVVYLFLSLAVGMITVTLVHYASIGMRLFVISYE